MTPFTLKICAPEEGCEEEVAEVDPDEAVEEDEELLEDEVLEVIEDDDEEDDPAVTEGADELDT